MPLRFGNAEISHIWSLRFEFWPPIPSGFTAFSYECRPSKEFISSIILSNFSSQFSDPMYPIYWLSLWCRLHAKLWDSYGPNNRSKIIPLHKESFEKLFSHQPLPSFEYIPNCIHQKLLTEHKYREPRTIITMGKMQVTMRKLELLNFVPMISIFIIDIPGTVGMDWRGRMELPF